MLELLDPEVGNIQALILAPTRELCQQIAQQIDLFSKHLPGIRAVAVFGGANIVTQIQQLRRPCQVVIATPGRLIDLANRKALKLDEIEYVVLDEADEMLNMGFQEDLNTILDLTPETKRTWLFSATMPKEIRRIVKQYMDDPLEVRVDPGMVVNTDIEHQYVIVRHTDKLEALTRFMDLDAELFGVVFCRTKRDAQDLAEQLMKRGYRADALHGDLSQPQRDRVMQRFKQRDLQVLIATDVAARGIDVNNLTHVFHHSLPNDPSYYTHRAGRTARAGKKGISIAFINRKEKAAINRIVRELDIHFAEVEIPSAAAIASARILNWAHAVHAALPNRVASDELVIQALSAFSDLSLEELMAQLVRHELANMSSGADLNWKETSEPGRKKFDRTAGKSERPKGKYSRTPGKSDWTTGKTDRVSEPSNSSGPKKKSFKPGFDEAAHKKKFGKKFGGTSRGESPSTSAGRWSEGKAKRRK